MCKRYYSFYYYPPFVPLKSMCVIELLDLLLINLSLVGFSWGKTSKRKVSRINHCHQAESGIQAPSDSHLHPTLSTLDKYVPQLSLFIVSVDYLVGWPIPLSLSSLRLQLSSYSQAMAAAPVHLLSKLRKKITRETQVGPLIMKQNLSVSMWNSSPLWKPRFLNLQDPELWEQEGQILKVGHLKRWRVEIISTHTPCFLDSGLMNSNTGKIVQCNDCYGLNVCLSHLPHPSSYIEILIINVMVLVKWETG